MFVMSSLAGSMPGRCEAASSSMTKASCLLQDVENGLDLHSSRMESGLNAEVERARAQGTRSSRGRDIFFMLLSPPGSSKEERRGGSRDEERSQWLM